MSILEAKLKWYGTPERRQRAWLIVASLTVPAVGMAIFVISRHYPLPAGAAFAIGIGLLAVSLNWIQVYRKYAYLRELQDSGRIDPETAATVGVWVFQFSYGVLLWAGILFATIDALLR